MTETFIPLDRAVKNFPEARQAAKSGPVIITTDGLPTHVLLTFETYQSLSSRSPKIADLFHYPGAADIEFEPERLDINSRSNDQE